VIFPGMMFIYTIIHRSTRSVIARRSSRRYISAVQLRLLQVQVSRPTKQPQKPGASPKTGAFPKNLGRPQITGSSPDGRLECYTSAKIERQTGNETYQCKYRPGTQHSQCKGLRETGSIKSPPKHRPDRLQWHPGRCNLRHKTSRRPRTRPFISMARRITNGGRRHWAMNLNRHVRGEFDHQRIGKCIAARRRYFGNWHSPPTGDLAAYAVCDIGRPHG